MKCVSTSKFLLAAACVTAGSLSAQAAVVSTDFEPPTYSVGDIAGQDGWAGDTMWEVSTTDAIAGQSLQSVTSTGDGRTSRSFASQTDTFYAGFKVKITNNDLPNFYWIAVSDDTDDNNSLGMVWSGATPNFAARGRMGSSNTGGTTATYTSGQVYQFVLQFAKSSPGGNYDTVSLYQDPAGTDINLLTPVSTVVQDTGLTALDTFWLRQGGDTTTDVLTLDNLIISDNFAEAVPEPGSMALLAIGGLCFMVRRRS
jgi:hypothetical protein